MKTKKFRYKIENTYKLSGYELVTGFAVDFQRVRFCVRHIGDNLWKTEHYDTGKFFGEYCMSKAQAIEFGINILEKTIDSGKYAEVIEALNRGEI